MKTTIYSFLLIICMSIATILSIHAQTTALPTVYLRNGSKISGKIKQDKNKGILNIKTSDGTRFVYHRDEVDSIAFAVKPLAKKVEKLNKYEFKQKETWNLSYYKIEFSSENQQRISSGPVYSFDRHESSKVGGLYVSSRFGLRVVALKSVAVYFNISSKNRQITAKNNSLVYANYFALKCGVSF